MGFRRQLIGGQVASLLLIVATAVTAIVTLHFAASREARVGDELTRDLAIVQRLRFDAEQLVATSRAYLLTAEPRDLERFAEAERMFEGGLRELRDRTLDIVGELDSNAVDRAAHDYVAVSKQAAQTRAAASDLRQIVPFFDDKVRPSRVAFEASLDTFVRRHQKIFDDELADARALSQRAEVIVAVSSALAVALGIMLSVVVRRRLEKQFAEVRAATEAANRAAAARQDVLAVVSHDLKNPLQAITLGASILEVPDDRARRHVDVIRNAAARMQHMIDELLSASRVDSGEIELVREPCAVRDLLDATHEMFAARATERSIALSVTAPDATVNADRERVLEVLSNLVGNAIELVSVGGEIALIATAGPDHVRFAVADNGPGIEAAHLPHLFDRYWQGRRKRGNLGLGLYICRRLVEAHGGQIGAETALGTGTTFWFTLPALAPSLRVPDGLEPDRERIGR
jgi:signal transduction histidine kinase